MVVLTRVARDAPAAAKIAEGLFRVRLDAFRDSTRGRADAGPEQKTNPLAMIAWL